MIDERLLRQARQESESLAAELLKEAHFGRGWRAKLLKRPNFKGFLTALADRVLRTRKLIYWPVRMGLRWGVRGVVFTRSPKVPRANINVIGEAILGEDEALRRIEAIEDWLKKPGTEEISVKISAVFSQIDVLAWDHTADVLHARLSRIFRSAMPSKAVTLDMESYADMALTVYVFKRVLDEPEFASMRAGIALQAYLPDAFLWQKDLTAWAKGRKTPIKIRLVKGANLGMERVTASLKGWPQAPFESKTQTDANFKRMLHFGLEKENARVVRIGVGSHNVFDIAYAITLSRLCGVEGSVTFEMLAGMAQDLSRAVARKTGNAPLLYCPVARGRHFQDAIAYLVRRFDENSGEGHFLRDAFEMTPGSEAWKSHHAAFLKSFELIDGLDEKPRHRQDRMAERFDVGSADRPFRNEPDTDWTIAENRNWVEAFNG